MSIFDYQGWVAMMREGVMMRVDKDDMKIDG
jgi:hypothetical protein